MQRNNTNASERLDRPKNDSATSLNVPPAPPCLHLVHVRLSFWSREVARRIPIPAHLRPLLLDPLHGRHVVLMRCVGRHALELRRDCTACGTWGKGGVMQVGLEDVVKTRECISLRVLVTLSCGVGLPVTFKRMELGLWAMRINTMSHPGGPVSL